MADLTVTASQVLPDTTYDIRRGIAAAAITAGQVVCLDPTTLTVKLFDANDTAVNQLTPGIALCSASAGQPVSWQEAAGAQVTIGAGAAPANGAVYVASATPGGIGAVADLAAGWVRAIVGIGVTGNKIKLIGGNSLITG
jgi:hypothetical protein